MPRGSELFPIFVLALALPAAAALGDGKALAPGLPEDVAANLRARVAAGERPGFAVGVVDEDGPRVYGFGSVSAARPEPPDGSTIYEIGSITKVFTALLLADMAARGEVKLDDPVAKYLPEDVSMPGGDAVTLAHLARHTAGLPRLPMNLQPKDFSNPYVDYDAERLYAFLSAFTPARAPGGQSEYSNLGAGLLGHVLTRHAGKSYEELVVERICRPLGLDDTAVTLDGDAAKRLAPGHAGGREVPGWDFDVLAGAGALRSTVDDMLRFLAAHLGLVETPLDEVMQRTWESFQPAGEGLEIGLGWVVRKTGGGRIVWHNGGTGGYRSFVGFDPAAKKGVVVLTNASGTGDAAVDEVGFHLLDPALPLREVEP